MSLFNPQKRMGLLVLPENVLRRMCPADRKALGKAGVTASEAVELHEQRAERVLQQQIESCLLRLNVFHMRAPMHKANSLPVGWPDFTVFLRNGVSLLVEVKTETGAIRPDQLELHAKFKQQTGREVALVRSYDQFVKLLEAVSQ